MIKIRKMEDYDWEMICSWWNEQRMPEPWKGMYPLTSFIAEMDGTPMLGASLFLMNCQSAAKIENLVGNPHQKIKRKECVKPMFRFLEELAQAWGYTHAVLFSYEDSLKKYYEELGYVKTLENVTTFSKRIGD